MRTGRSGVAVPWSNFSLLVLAFCLMGRVKQEHAEKLETLSLYWHFVDGVWVVVFLVVYVLGR